MVSESRLYTCLDRARTKQLLETTEPTTSRISEKMLLDNGLAIFFWVIIQFITIINIGIRKFLWRYFYFRIINNIFDVMWLSSIHHNTFGYFVILF